MKDLHQFFPFSTKRFLIICGLVSSLVFLSTVSKFYSSGDLLAYIPYRYQAKDERQEVHRTKSYRNNDFAIQAARHELNCKDIRPGIPDSSDWPTTAISLKDLNLPNFLTDYKNPCWRSGARNTSLSCLPYVYLAGFPKCGTTDLYFRLTQHPLVAPGHVKEPHYLTRFMYKNRCTHRFSTSRDVNRCNIDNYCYRYFRETSQKIQSNELLHRGKREKTQLYDEWRKVFTKEKQKVRHPMITVDGSASTAWDNKHWREIKENRGCPEPIVGPSHLITRLNPGVRVIFILRDPTDRLYSDYVYFTRKTEPSREEFHEKVTTAISFFKNCTNYRPLRLCLLKGTSVRIHIGIYHVFISDWLATLPRSHLLVIHSESYRTDVAGTLNEIFRFLGLAPLSERAMEMIANLKEKNTTKNKSRVGEMLPETRALLKQFYSEHNERLARILKDERFAWRESVAVK